jgi:hypothetical protein
MMGPGMGEDVFGTGMSRRGLVTTASIALMMVAPSVVVRHASTQLLAAPLVLDSSSARSGATLRLSDDDQGTALFHASRLAPGRPITRCITVRASGAAARLRLYGAAYTTTKSLAPYLQLQVERGAAGSGCSATAMTRLYRGTVADFGVARTSWRNGVRAGDTGETGRAAWTFRLTVTLAASTPNAAQGGRAHLGFTWESQPA